MTFKTISYLILFVTISKVRSLHHKNYYVVKNQPVKEDYEHNSRQIDLHNKREESRGPIKHEMRSLLRTIDSKNAEKVQDAHEYCRSFTTCFECVKSMWHPCDWCHNYGCTHVGAKLCPITSTDTAHRNLSSCPFIQHSSPILVPAGVKTHIEIPINIPDPILNNDEIICQIKMTDNMIHLKGVILMNMLYCFPAILETKEGVDYGTFSIIWGGAEPYSNEIPLVVYQCDGLADSCEECRKVPTDYRCGWCEDTQSCTIASRCSDLIRWSLNRLTCQFNSKQMYFV